MARRRSIRAVDLLRQELRETETYIASLDRLIEQEGGTPAPQPDPLQLVLKERRLHAEYRHALRRALRKLTGFNRRSEADGP